VISGKLRYGNGKVFTLAGYFWEQDNLLITLMAITELTRHGFVVVEGAILI
jgi:hypothetical protein